MGSRTYDPGGRPGRRPGRRTDGGAAGARRVHRVSGHVTDPAPAREEPPPMSNTRKFVIGGLALYVLLVLLAVLFFGSAGRNDEFKPQNEFKLDTWVALPGPFDINKAVLYLVLAALLTVFTMYYVARRMQQKPNRVQTAVETLYGLMRDNITRGNMDDKMAAKWFPFIGALFLFIWYSNLIGFIPLPTNTEEKFNLFGANVPSFAIYAATANLSVPLVLALIVFIAFVAEAVRAKGPIGSLKSLIPAGIHGPAAIPIFLLEVASTFMRLLSLSVRLFANMLAGHLIIL